MSEKKQKIIKLLILSFFVFFAHNLVLTFEFLYCGAKIVLLFNVLKSARVSIVIKVIAIIYCRSIYSTTNSMLSG